MLGVPAAAAQVPDSARADTGRRVPDSVSGILRDKRARAAGSGGAAGDSTAAGAAAAAGGLTRRDTVEDRYTALDVRTRMVVPVLPRLGETGPVPAAGRIVFDRDSIEWVNAQTVADLLARVPGIYVWRGGRVGRPEPVNFQGRGTASVTYLLDGMPYVAVGPDSLTVDPALFSLNFLDRVEVERWPGRLEVRLYTRQHDRLAPRSRIVVGTGSDRLAMYAGELEERSRTGLGFVAAGDYLRAPATTGTTGDFTNSQLWLQGSYVPSARLGLEYQLVRSSVNRDAFTGGLGGTGAAREGKRTDAQFRGSFGQRADGFGPRLDLVYTRTGWDSAGITQQVNQLGGMVSLRTATLSGGVSAFHRNTWTSFDSRAWLGWSPAGAVTLSGEAVYQRHFGGRATRWVGGRAGVALPLGLGVEGGFRAGQEVAAPALTTDTAQRLRDLQVSATLEHGWIGAEATWSRDDGYQPFSYQPYPDIVAIAAHGRTEWLTLSGHLAPWRWLVVDGWYANPRRGAVDGLPPRHYMANGTIRSKFLRQFPSGYFELKLQLGVEGWTAGTLGTDAMGAPVVLPAARFLRSLVQMEIGHLTVFWDARNIGGSNAVFVPGFRMPQYANAFGIRWEFLN